jgi:hypothetical protein
MQAQVTTGHPGPRLNGAGNHEPPGTLRARHARDGPERGPSSYAWMAASVAGATPARTPMSRFGTKGVAGSNPVSPTQEPIGTPAETGGPGLRRLLFVNGPRHRRATPLKASSRVVRIRACERLPNTANFRGSTPERPRPKPATPWPPANRLGFRNSSSPVVCAVLDIAPKCDPHVGKSGPASADGARPRRAQGTWATRYRSQSTSPARRSTSATASPTSAGAPGSRSKSAGIPERPSTTGATSTLTSSTRPAHAAVDPPAPSSIRVFTPNRAAIFSSASGR